MRGAVSAACAARTSSGTVSAARGSRSPPAPDGPTGLRLKGHIFVADKGDYYAIADGLPQAEGADPRLTTQ
jgi:hypothetical protein